MAGLETSRGGRLRRVLPSVRCVMGEGEITADERGFFLPASVRPHTGPASTRVRSSTRIPSSACWISPGSARTRLGASSILDGYGGDVRLEYALWGLVHSVVRAQRSGAEVPSEHLCFELFCRPLGERVSDGLFCGLALQDIE
jgi:hypothetical protein